MERVIPPQVPQRVVDELQQLGSRRRLVAGQALFDEGRESHTVYLVFSGIVKLVILSRNGGRSLVALRGDGDFVGQYGAFDFRPRGAGAEALVATEVLCIPSDRFRALVARHGDLALLLLSELSRQVRETTRRIAELADEQAGSLVARRLVQLAVDPRLAALRVDHRDPIRLQSPLSQREMAAWAGVSERSVSAVLRGLRDRGLIVTGRLWIEIHDLNGLRTEAGLLALR